MEKSAFLTVAEYIRRGENPPKELLDSLYSEGLKLEEDCGFPEWMPDALKWIGIIAYLCLFIWQVIDIVKIFI